MATNEGERYSRETEPSIIKDEDDRAYAEAKNALVQFDQTVSLAETWIRNSNFKLRPSVLLDLNRWALVDIHPGAGTYRTGNMEIVGSKHDPVPASAVASEIEALCDYVNENWDSKSAIHLAAYVLWELNWIHPFADGNGRTARAVSYLVLCAKLGFTLPGLNTVPKQISGNKKPYYDALEDADAALKQGKINVSSMEALLRDRFANQLQSWLGKSEHGDDWIFCLTVANMATNRRDDDETTPPQPHTGVQGEGGPGGTQGREDPGRVGAAV